MKISTRLTSIFVVFIFKISNLSRNLIYYSTRKKKVEQKSLFSNDLTSIQGYSGADQRKESITTFQLLVNSNPLNFLKYFDIQNI